MYSLLLQETSKLITMPRESTPSQGFEQPNVCSKKSTKMGGLVGITECVQQTITAAHA